MPPVLSRLDEGCYSASDAAELFLTSSACIFVASTVFAVAYKLYALHRNRTRESKQRCWMRSLDTAPLVPSTARSSGTVVVGVWMSDDINPKFIHRVSTSAFNEHDLERMSDSSGYVYLIAEPSCEQARFVKDSMLIPVKPASHEKGV